MSDFDGFGFDWNQDGRVGAFDELLTYHVMEDIPKEEARARFEDMKGMRERGLPIDEAEFQACADLLGETVESRDPGLGLGIDPSVYDRVYGSASTSSTHRDDIAISGSPEEAGVGDLFTYIPDDETDPLETRRQYEDSIDVDCEYDSTPWTDGVDYEEDGYDYWAELERIENGSDEDFF